ncbi:MAG: phosphodiester glycosidase family protein [Chthoniobacterales bacterium]
MQLRRAAALFCLFATAGLAQAEWQIKSAEREASPDESIEHWTTVVEDSEMEAQASLHFAVFETRAATLRVIDQPNTPRSDLSEVMAGTKALAGVNGGYFDPEDAPVGLMVSQGRVLSPLRKAKLLSGVLLATGSRVDVVRAAHFSVSHKIKSALQCGPVLVERATPVAGLNDTRLARRTFAAVDGNGRAALGVCSAVSLAQLSRLLCLTNVAGKMKIARALNLDGGSSSAFWFAGKDGIASFPEQKTVRDFVAIVPR